MATSAPVIVLVLMLLFGTPIAVALAVSGMLGIYLVTGDFDRMLGILSLAPYSTVADYALTTIPMFILMAYFSASSGLARDLYAAAAAWLSHIRGGLAIATVFACGIFGAMSGASTAAASVMSKIAMPEMRRHGYSEELGAGAIGVGATLDILIPPSIAMVIYGIATQTSIGKLLIAGVLPGILVGVFLCAMIYICWGGRPPTASMCQNEVVADLKRGSRPWTRLSALVWTRPRVFFSCMGWMRPSSRCCARSCGVSEVLDVLRAAGADADRDRSLRRGASLGARAAARWGTRWCCCRRSM